MRYFVYELIDPRSGKPFYVGKGQGDRPSHHLRESRRGVQSHKCNVIRKILAAGLTPEIKIFHHTRVERFAYRWEAERIATIGLENLTNVHPGGKLFGAGALHRRKNTQSGMRASISMGGGAWTSKQLDKIALSLAHAGLFLANGWKIVVPSTGELDLTPVIRETLGNFVRNLGSQKVRERLAQEHLYFTGKRVVQIFPETMAEIRKHAAALKTRAQAESLANSNNLLTI